MEIEKNKIMACKYCGRTGWTIQNTKSIGKTITKEKCIYCDGKGFIYKKEDKKEKNINNNNLIQKGGNK